MKPQPAIFSFGIVIGCLFPRVANSCDLTVVQVDGDTVGSIALNEGAPFHATTGEVSDLRCIEIPDSSTVIALWNEAGSDAVLAPYYAVSLDGMTVNHVTSTSYQLMLRRAQFDPQLSSVYVDAELAADADTRLHVVQFMTQPLEIYIQQLESIGAVVLGFVPNHALLVHMEGDTTAAVEALPYVRAIVPYHPAFRLESSLLVYFTNAGGLLPEQRYYLRLSTRDGELQTLIAERIAALGGTVNGRHVGTGIIEATLTPELLSTAIRWNEVLHVQRWSEPALAMDNARRIGGAYYVESVAGFEGQGVRGVVVDLMLADHYEFTPEPFRLTDPPPWPYYDCHGESVYGIVFSDGSGDPRARGILPEGEGVFVDFFSGPFFFGRLVYTCLSTVSPGVETCEEACEVPDVPAFPVM